MSLWTIVPVKAFGEAKHRLAPRLSDRERQRLARCLAKRTLSLLIECELAPRLVVTADPEAASLAEELGCTVLAEQSRGHSAAVEQAAAWASERGAEAILTIATDLPLLTADDILALRTAVVAGRLAIAPDLPGTGTNAIAVAPPGFRFHFGPNSFRLHLAEARRRRLEVRVVRRPGLAADLDEPADLDLVRRVGWPAATASPPAPGRGARGGRAARGAR